MDAPWIAIAEIQAPHGVRGGLRIRPLGSFPERFRPGVAVRLASEPERARRIERVRPHRGALVIKVEGIDDRSAAEALRGVRLVVPPADRHPLPPGSYYVDDLRGLRVVTSTGREMGVVVDVEPNPAHDLFVVRLDHGGRALVPAVRALVRLEPEHGRLVVEDIPGLLTDAEGRP